MTDEQKKHWGLWLGLLGVMMFAATLPMTRLAVGSAENPQLSPWFVSFGRAAVAGVLSLFYLAFTRSPKPARHEWAPLIVAAAGNVVGFPVCLGLALREVGAVHASVVVGILPLATAVLASRVLRQKPSLGFWLCALLGTALVLVYMTLKSGLGHWGFSHADLLLLGAVLWAALGYVVGGQLTKSLGAEQVICWMLVVSLPLTFTASLFFTPEHPVPTASWMGFAYVSLFSVWIGFFAWYRGLDWGGMVRVSQVQLLQPFFAMVFAHWLLGETLDAMTLAFAVAVIATVFIGRKMPVR